MLLLRIVRLGYAPSLVVLGTGLGFVAAVAGRPEYEKYLSLPHWVYTYVLVIGICLSVATSLTLCGILICTLVLASRRKTWCSACDVSRAKLKCIHDYLATWFGTEVPPIRRMCDWHKRNNTVFQAIYRTRLSWGKATRDLVGVFKILPLTAEAALLLEEEKVTGTTFLPAHIAAKGEKPAGLYIGDVAGDTAQAKAEILRCLQRLIQDHFEAGIPIYTRPLTIHGTRLVRKYNFFAIHADVSCGAAGRIHKLLRAG